MTGNHIRVSAVPEQKGSLAVVLWRTHGRYAQYLNARKVRSGHLWQNRFYSCPLGPSHLWTELGHVERNPVRAGLDEQACDWEWSSAAAHLMGQAPHLVLDMEFWRSAGGMTQRRELRATHAGNLL